jgi:hypothetical protein
MGLDLVTIIPLLCIDFQRLLGSGRGPLDDDGHGLIMPSTS